MKTVRYHVDAKSPINPPMADVIYFAQMCGDGHYRQCVDVVECMTERFERWADKNNSVINFCMETR